LLDREDEGAFSSETSASIYQSLEGNGSEDLNRQ
jgi:hypothetical protein